MDRGGCGMNRHGKQCDKNYHAECIEMIKEALQDNKADHLPDRPLNYERIRSKT